MEDFLGAIGRWHWPVLIMNAYVTVPHAWFLMAPSFMEPTGLSYWCAPPENVSLADWKVQNKDLDLSCTARYDGIVQKCSRWEFNTSEVYRPMQMDFGTVCDRAILTSVHQSLLMGGLMAGNLIFSHLSDWFGRKPLFGVCIVFQIVFNLLLLLSPNYTWILVITFIGACGYGGLQNIPFTLALESVGQSSRAMVSACEEVGWMFGLIFLPAFTYYIRDWRYLQLLLIPPVLLTLALYCFCDESPRWLLVNGKLEATRSLLEKIAKTNGFDDPQAEVDKILNAPNKETVTGKASVFDLFRCWDIAKITISFYTQFAVSVLVYFSLIFFIVEVGSNPHLNLFISGLLELPLLPISYLVLKKLKRRTLYYWLHVPSFIATLVLAFLPEGHPWIQVGLASVGKWASQILFNLGLVHVAEIFPTEVRALAVGSSLTLSRLGAIIAPFMKGLGTQGSSLLCSATIFFALAWTLVLPETSQSSLPDTLQETRRNLQKSKNDRSDGTLTELNNC